nr:T9SS type A sorting domain-containing protein [uncultured Pedobacter sp.]
MKKIFTLSIFLITSHAIMAQFSPGKLILARYGNGVTNLGALSNSKPVPLTLIEYDPLTFTPTGQELEVPYQVAGSRFAIPGNQGANGSIDGMVTRSADGRYLIVAGYDVAASLDNNAPNSAPATDGKVIIRIDKDKNIDFAPLSFAQGLRNVASQNGENLYVTSALTGQGIFKTTFSDVTASTVIEPNLAYRNVGIFNGQLFASGVYSVGKGLTDLATTPELIPGLTAVPSNLTMLFLDTDPTVSNDLDGNDVLYITDNLQTNGRGIIKYYYDAPSKNWIIAPGNPDPSFEGALFAESQRTTTGLIGYYIPPVAPATQGSVRLFYTTGNSSNTGAFSATRNAFYTILDENPRNSVVTTPSATLIENAGYKYFFRSVCFTPEVADNTPPSKVSSASATTMDNSIDVIWDAPAVIANDFSNYTVIRYSSMPTDNDNPTDKLNYNIGEKFTKDNEGTIVYRGPKLEFVDNTISAGGTYYYRIYTLDNSFNYSEKVDASSTITLPLNFLSFTGNVSLNGAKFTWTTANELNVKGFTLEKSIDGSDFSPVCDFSARNTSTKQAYFAQDNKLTFGTTYYRLKITDNDGSYYYSNIVVLNSSENSVFVYPNPTVNEIHVRLENFDSAVNEIALIDMQGKIVYKTVANGNDNVISMDALNKGTYVLCLTKDGKIVKKEKIIKM